MSGVSDLQLEDLPGVESHLISKLKRAGTQSVLDLTVSIPPELAAGGGDYDGSGVAVDTETIRSYVKGQKGTYGFRCTKQGVLHSRRGPGKKESLVRFTTGSRNLDTFLKGEVDGNIIGSNNTGVPTF